MKNSGLELRNGFLRFWLGPSDPIRLDAFRVGMGLSLFLYQMAWWEHPYEWLTAEGFHVPPHLFGYYPILPPMPPWALPAFGVVLFGSILFFILGWHLRWASRLALACVVCLSLMDPLSTFTLNNLFIVCLAIFAIIGEASYWTIRRNAAANLQSVWPIRVLQATLFVLYGSAACCKVFQGEWLESSEVFWSQAQGPHRTRMASWLLSALPPGAWALFQNVLLGFEVAAPLMFLNRRLRPWAMALGVLLHLILALVMHRAIFFRLQMICLTVLPFLSEEAHHRIRRYILKKAGRL